jgi:quercetin 2,3-dioxygenase
MLVPKMTTLTRAKIEIRPFASLGKADHGWLNANHHFSFAGYHDPDRMHWGNIRVWNDDAIAAQTGFPPHAHDNMEIITYVREGAITHRDSMGNIGRTEAGDVQVMSAGTGVQHSEYNVEGTECRLFQIWIMPRKRGIAPTWGQRAFPNTNDANGFTVLASGYGEAGALKINADAKVLGANMQVGASLEYQIDAGRCAYLVVAKGRVQIDGQDIGERDGVAVEAGVLKITALEDAELVMVDSL